MVNCMTVLLGIGMVVVFIHDMVVPAAWLLPTDIRASLNRGNPMPSGPGCTSNHPVLGLASTSVQVPSTRYQVREWHIPSKCFVTHLCQMGELSPRRHRTVAGTPRCSAATCSE